MKNKLFINVSVSLLLIAGSGLAFAQNPRLYPRGGTASPSPATSARETTTTTTSTSERKGGGKASLSSADKDFIKEAAKGGMMEVAMGRLAEKNASDSEVKNFGSRMVADHGKANSELKSLAAEKGVELPAEKEKGGWKSDKDYMSMMVKDHEKDLAKFEDEAKNGSDPDLKRFADKTSKIIRKHLQMAKEIDGKLK